MSTHRTTQRLAQLARDTFGPGALAPRPPSRPVPPPHGARWFWQVIERDRRALRHNQRRRTVVRMAWVSVSHTTPYPRKRR